MQRPRPLGAHLPQPSNESYNRETAIAYLWQAPPARPNDARRDRGRDGTRRAPYDAAAGQAEYQEEPTAAAEAALSVLPSHTYELLGPDDIAFNGSGYALA